MALVTVTARKKKVKTDQQGNVGTPATDITFDGADLDVNPALVSTIQVAGAQLPDSDYFLVRMNNSDEFYVDAGDKAALNV